jgi:hypothetical protein
MVSRHPSSGLKRATRPKLLLDCREAIELAIEKDGLGLVELKV